MVKIACLIDALSEHFELEVSPVEGQSLQQKDTKKTKQNKTKQKQKLKA